MNQTNSKRSVNSLNSDVAFSFILFSNYVLFLAFAGKECVADPHSHNILGSLSQVMGV